MPAQPPWEKYANAQPKAAVDDTAAWNAYAGVTPSAAGAEEAPQAPARTGPAESLHRAGVLARGLLTGPTSTVGMVGDALNTAINLTGKAIGHNPNLGMPSQAIQQAMTSAGLPQAENTTEKVVEGLAGIGTGSKDPLMGAITRMLPAATAPALTVRDQSINAGKRLGYMAPPDQQGGAVGSMLGTIAGKKPLAQAMTGKNQNVTDTLSRNVAGLPPKADITEEAVSHAMDATQAAGYDPIKALGNVTTGSTYRKALDEIQKNNHSISQPVQDDIDNLISKYRVHNFDSEDLLKHIQYLRNQSYNHALDTTLRSTARDISSALEDNIGLNLQGRAKLLSQQGKGDEAQAMIDRLGDFKDARTKLAQQSVILNAIERGTGNVSLNKIALEGERHGPGYFTGDLKDMANFSKATHGVTGVPTTTEQPFITSPVTNGFATLAAHVMGGPVAGGAVAGFPFGQHFLRSALMSNAGQKSLQPRLDPRLLNKLLHNKGVVNAMPAAMQASGLFGQE